MKAKITTLLQCADLIHPLKEFSQALPVYIFDNDFNKVKDKSNMNNDDALLQFKNAIHTILK